jgi:hypothetical protein
MSLIKHNCANCGFDLEFPEQVERICCPRCNSHLQIEVYEDVVSLKVLKPLSTPDAAEQSAPPRKRVVGELDQDIKNLDKQIDHFNRQLAQRRSSAFSSLSVAFLFFCFSLVWFLADRDLMAIFCATIMLAMTAVAGSALHASAQTRRSLVELLGQREQLEREIRPNIPRIF